MSHYKDWRPHSLNIESMATDAQLTRIEAKLDKLLLLAEADGFCPTHPFQHSFKTESGLCNLCGKPMKHYG